MFTDTPLSDSDRKAIHDLALNARDILITETRDLLESAYGLKPDGTLSALSRLPNLTNDLEGQETHRRLGKFLDDEVRGGLERREAIEKLVKEVAFTHLNRLVAFKMLEARKLIRQTVSRGKESNGFKFFLAEHPDEEKLWLSGESGADNAYRHFLLWQSEQVAREIKVLFDATNLPSRLFPRPNALKQLLDLLNAESPANAWTNAETVGWVYQYFNEREKADVFERLYKKKQKIRRQDIPAATQLFTPRWIVRFLVENTLGRTWLELHPDSRLREELRYLVPLSGEWRGESGENHSTLHSRRSTLPPPRLARDITLLDPACGTMHFGLVAFDLFAEMYREELDRAGEAGWAETPSVSNAADIPAAIIANNLFGIDIDLRAVQLSALTLYLKAKELNKDARITDSNLACADVLALNGERLNAFLQEMNFSKPAYERLIRALWARLKNINQLGSLLRLEQEIAALVQQERDLYEREGRQPDLFGERARFEDEAAREEYWRIIEAQLIQAFDEFARRSAARGVDETFFAGEATKGLRVLELMLRRYDCVTANPPYMGKRNMNDTLAEFLDDAYPNAKGDLYTAFITRCAEFVHDGGRLGMITQQSFMFLSSYESLRDELLARFAIETMAHTGPHAFAEIGGEKVNTTVFVLRAEPDAERRANEMGTYFRLVKADDKQAAFERALVDASNTYCVQQKNFRKIPGAPYVYWAPSDTIQLFETLDSLTSAATPKQGLTTADNTRFIRYWWEVSNLAIRFGCNNRDEALRTRARWFPLIKGGFAKRWYGGEREIVNWENDGNEVKSYITFRYPYLNGKWEWVAKNPDSYFHEGTAYSAVVSARLYFRWMPSGYICEHASNAIFPEVSNWSARALTGLFNSEIVAFMVGFNQTINVNVADLARIPLPQINSTQLEAFEFKTSECVLVSKFLETTTEISWDFITPPSWHTGIQDQDRAQSRLAALERQIDDEVYRLYGISDQDRAAIEAELGESESQIADGESQMADGESQIAESDPNASDTQSFDAAQDKSATGDKQSLAVRWISYAIGIVMGRFQSGIAGELGTAVYRRSDFAIGSLLAPDEAEFDELVGPSPQPSPYKGEGASRFAYIDDEGGRHVFSREVEEKLRALAHADGIVVLDEGHPDDLPKKVETALELMLGEKGAEDLMDEIGGDLRRFLEREFFPKWHVKWYQKRPIYWLLQSPRKLYGLYLYHERINKDTLFRVQRRYLDSKIRLTETLLKEKRDAAKAMGEARERRTLNKQADELERLLDDLKEFARRLKAITDHGYDPDINDGVILNLAPLYEVIPAWSKEPQKYWQGLERGDYDWAHIAMKYFPERVKEKCKTDKSLAIAHGLA